MLYPSLYLLINFLFVESYYLKIGSDLTKMTSTLSRISSTANNSRNRYLIHCKKHLKEILSSGVLGVEAASLDIIELIPADKYTKIDVNCKLPICNDFDKQLVKRTPTALAFSVQQYMNSADSELRSVLHKSYPKAKIPFFQFSITEEAYLVNAPPSELENIQSSEDVSTTTAATTILPSFIKPSNVYGLERDKLIRIINSRLKSTRKKCHPSEPRNLVSDSFEEVNNPRECNQLNQTSTAAWAKYWKERQDWRAIAKRDRRLAHQSVGLEFLTLRNQKE
ncbi:hypothetical protein EWB00_001885 [Schistosoma japonicum]|uniref:Uncharacterized protein n=2 Tax=Schistosoma japonicum TaxID=6182 RepID=A0A4Z2DDV7_SCHJA|nr:hypothetical protein EWB00_001885 [Schistosoma japonicum]